MDIFFGASNKQLLVHKVAGLACEAASNHSVFYKEKSSSLASQVKYINSLINSKTKRQGLCYLLIFLTQCNDSLLKEEGEKWFKLVIKAYSPKKSFLFKQVIATILSILLRKSAKIHELHTRLSRIEPTYIDCFLQAESQWRKSAFECIGEYLRHFPGPSLMYKTKIENTIIKCLNETYDQEWNQGNVSDAATIYALLPPSGTGKGSASVKSEAKGSQLNNLIALSHAIMDRLLDGVIEQKKYDHSRTHPFPVKILEQAVEIKNPYRMIMSNMVCPLINAYSFIAKVVTASSDTIVVSPRNLTEVILRILQVDLKSITKIPGQEFRILAFSIPSIQQKALQLLILLLESLDCFGPFCTQLQEQLISTIINCIPKPDQSTQELSNQGEQTKILAYEALTTLTQVYNSCHFFTKPLVNNLVADVTPEKDLLLLSGSLSSVKIKKKKHKKGGYTVEEAPTENSNKILSSFREEIAEAALKTIEAIFLHGHHTMQIEHLKMLDSSLMEIEVNPGNNSAFTGLYKDPSLRKHFYQTILAYSMHPHPCLPPSYSAIIHALSLGAQDPCKEVVVLCKDGLSRLSFITANPQVSIFLDAVIQTPIDSTAENSNSNQKDDLEMAIENGFEELISLDPSSEAHLNNVSDNGEPSPPSNTKDIEDSVLTIDTSSDDNSVCIVESDSQPSIPLTKAITLDAPREEPRDIQSAISDVVEVNVNKRSIDETNAESSSNKKRRKTKSRNKKPKRIDNQSPPLNTDGQSLPEVEIEYETKFTANEESFEPQDESVILDKILSSFNDADPDSE